MLRLLRQPGIRLATRSIAQQRIQFRGFTNSNARQAEPNLTSNEYNRLVSHSISNGLPQTDSTDDRLDSGIMSTTWNAVTIRYSTYL